MADKIKVEDENIKILGSLTIDKSAYVSLDIEVLGKLTVGELYVKKVTFIDGIVQVLESITTRNLIVTDWAQFLADVLFKGDITFEGRPTFNKDTAGSAEIKKDAQEVAVVFDKEYAQVPLITISITLDEQVSDKDKALLSAEELTKRLEAQNKLEQDVLNGDLRYIVIRRNTKGFILKLNKSAPADVKFSWTAIAVKDARLSTSSGSAVLSSTYQSSSPSPSLSPSPTPTPTPTPSSSPSPSPSPTPAPSPSPPKIITINETELGYLRIRDGPATSYNEIGQVEVGSTFEVFEQSDPQAETGVVWYQIEYEDGKYGWISGAYVSVN